MGSRLPLIDLKKRAELVLKSQKIKSDNFENDIPTLINELNLHQIELEIQNEDLQNTVWELEKLNDKYLKLFELAPLCYFTLDQNGIILEVNSAGSKLLGVLPKDLIQKNFVRYIAPDFQHIYSYHRQNILNKNELQSCEVKILKKNGSIFFAQIKSIKLIHPKNGELQILSFINDISEQKHTEFLTHNHQNKIASSEKNQVMNELLNNVIQELNHPLGVINNYLQGIIRRLENGTFDNVSIIDALRKSMQQFLRASDIILRIKNFNYGGELNYESVDINEIIQHTITLINFEILEYPVIIVNRCRLPNLKLQIDKIHIQQVLLNLVRNAIEAMKDAKTDSPKICIEANKISKQFLEISIIDNGPGFDKKSIHKLTDPNFTSKAYGVGLGLAICRRIIEAHKGKLSIELNPITGACFKFTLPI